jgi:TolA-binding protein
MKQLLVLSVLLIALVGCGRGAAPAPMSLQEIPAALQKAFQGSKDELKMQIQGVSMQVEHNQLSPASFQLQNLLGDRSLSKDQSALIARVLVTINASLQKQLEIQEAAVSAPPNQTRSVKPGAPPPELPPNAPPMDDQAAAQARMMRSIYRRTK